MREPRIVDRPVYRDRLVLAAVMCWFALLVGKLLLGESVVASISFASQAAWGAAICALSVRVYRRARWG
jgi:hypothetical protein